MFTAEFIYDNIVPINFFGGTGGTFLCHFISSAKYNNKKLYEFGIHGSAHNFFGNDWTDLDINTHAHSIVNSLADKINHIHNLSPLGNGTPPFYTTIHGTNTHETKKFFKRMIHIHYSTKNITQIAKIYVAKLFGEKNKNTMNCVAQLTPYIRHTILFCKAFSPYDDENVCNIDFEDMIKNDPDILISKLSSFTGIPKDNFFKENLLMWREKTISSVDKIFGDSR